MFSSFTRVLWSRSRIVIATIVAAGLAGTFLTAQVTSAQAGDEQMTPVVGSFGVGAGVTGGIDEGTGAFGVQVPVTGLPGVVGTGGGSVDVGVSYSQDLAAGGVDVFGLGTGWGWSISRVDVDGGVRVFPASGGVYNADASQPSGLDRYTLGDLIFTQESGVLPERTGVIGQVEYAYSLTYPTGTDYFTTIGDLVARKDIFGNRTD